MSIKRTVTGREIFVNHQANRRSGHMGHALLDCGEGKIIDFYSNCDGERVAGHSGYGWMEYKVSRDYGRTFGEAKVLECSRKVYDEGIHTALCEKAVKAPNGDILLFFQITDASKPISCEPWSSPGMAVSKDNGETFSDVMPTGMDAGRIYDVVCDGKSVYVIMQSNDAAVIFLGNRPEHCYKLYRSDDSGKSFKSYLISIDAQGRGYGALEFMEDGALIAYVYDANHEDAPVYAISRDRGVTWSEPARASTKKLIRNPQLVRVDNIWFLLGRNGGAGDGLVLYTSDDGISWDEGEMLDKRPEGGGTGYYSNMLVIREPGEKPRVLMQYSHVYDKNRVNIAHRYILL